MKTRLLALVCCAAILGGCNLVPTANAPIPIGRKFVPFGLLGKTIPGTNHGRVQFITQIVYIVDATDHLAPSSRIVPTPPTLASVLRELVIGPTTIETATGYSSAIPKGLVILGANVKNHVGFISIPAPLSDLPVNQRLLALGQLTLTSATVGATKGIEILVAGVAQPSLRPGGSSAILVTPHDYESLLSH